MLVDYDKKTCHFNTPEFRKLVEYYKDFLPLILPASKCESPLNMLKHRSCVMANSYGMVNPPDLSYEFEYVLSDANEHLVIVPKPSYSGDKHIYVGVDDCIGINSKCKNKEAAYNFIKILLSDDIQSGVRPDGYAIAGTGTPVSKKGYKISFDNWLHLKLDEVPKDTLYFVDNNADRFENAQIDDQAIGKIIGQAVSSYIEGKKTLDEAIKEIDYKVGIFLNE